MTLLDNIKQLLRHVTTFEQLNEVKKMVALIEMELKEYGKKS